MSLAMGMTVMAPGEAGVRRGGGRLMEDARGADGVVDSGGGPGGEGRRAGEGREASVGSTLSRRCGAASPCAPAAVAEVGVGARAPHRPEEGSEAEWVKGRAMRAAAAVEGEVECFVCVDEADV